MVLVDTKSFLFGHGTLKISLQTENHLNGWLSVVIHFDEESGKRGTGIEVYNIFYNQYSNLSEHLAYPPPDGGDEPVTFFNPGRFFCSCQALE